MNKRAPNEFETHAMKSRLNIILIAVYGKIKPKHLIHAYSQTLLSLLSRSHKKRQTCRRRSEDEPTCDVPRPNVNIQSRTHSTQKQAPFTDTKPPAGETPNVSTTAGGRANARRAATTLQHPKQNAQHSETSAFLGHQGIYEPNI